MNKTKTLLFTPFLAISLMASSCSSGSSKIALVFGDMHAEDVVDIDYADLKSRKDDEETFILTVEPDSACVCWSDFHPIIKEYISKNHLIVYHIKYGSFGDKDNFGLKIRKGYTTFAIFENGSIKQNVLSDSNEIFKSKDKFNDYMSNVVNLPHFFYVNLEDVDNMRKSAEQNVVYFARNNCGDCTYVDKNVLKQYAQENVNRKDMFILDCESLGIRVYDENKKLTPESQVAWDNFKIQYGLADNYNKTYGFDTGYVPTFQVIKCESDETKYVSGCVYFNDSLAEEDGRIVVKQTFYSNERAANLQYLADFSGKKVLEGLEVKADDATKYGDSYYWKQDAANKYHEPLLRAFLNYYLK